MPDRSMKQRTTYPHIRGRVEDAVGPIPLDLATALTLWVEVEGGDLFELVAEALDPEQPENVFRNASGEEVGANFQAQIGASGMTAETNPALRGVLEANFGSGLVTFFPDGGDQQFIELAVTENVQAAP